MAAELEKEIGALHVSDGAPTVEICPPSPSAADRNHRRERSPAVGADIHADTGIDIHTDIDTGTDTGTATDSGTARHRRTRRQTQTWTQARAHTHAQA